MLRTVLISAVLIAIPLSVTSQQIWTTANDQAEIEEATAAWLEGTDLRSTIRLSGSEIVIALEGSDDVPDAGPLSAEIDDIMERPHTLSISYVPTVNVYQGESPG